jgi:hypothetical protein
MIPTMCSRMAVPCGDFGGKIKSVPAEVAPSCRHSAAIDHWLIHGARHQPPASNSFCIRG